MTMRRPYTNEFPRVPKVIHPPHTVAQIPVVVPRTLSGQPPLERLAQALSDGPVKHVKLALLNRASQSLVQPVQYVTDRKVR